MAQDTLDDDIDLGRRALFRSAAGVAVGAALALPAARAAFGAAPAGTETPAWGDPATLVASSALARDRLGWQPRHDRIEGIIDSAWRWHLQPRF